MVYWSKKSLDILKARLICIAGFLVYILMPYLAFRILNDYENTRLRTLNGVIVQIWSDNFSLLNIYVVWILLTFLVIAVYVCAAVVKNKSKPNFSRGELAVLSIMSFLSLVSLILVIVSASSAGLDLYGEGIMFIFNIISLAGLVVSYMALKKIPALLRSRDIND